VVDYDQSGIPLGEHVLVANLTPRPGQMEPRLDLDERLKGRKVLHLGSFSPQKLEYYWVAAQTPAGSSPPSH